MVGKAKKPAPPNESSVLLLQDCGQAPASKMMEILLIKKHYSLQEIKHCHYHSLYQQSWPMKVCHCHHQHRNHKQQLT